MRHHIVLRVVAKFVIPLIMLFALYVQFHGEYSPGGGFQAGVIFGAAFILHALIFGVGTTEQVAPRGMLRVLASLGVLLFAGTGVASILAGGDYLDYDLLAPDPLVGQHLGILLVELGVGITVASVMMLLFFSFARRGLE